MRIAECGMERSAKRGQILAWAARPRLTSGFLIPHSAIRISSSERPFHLPGDAQLSESWCAIVSRKCGSLGGLAKFIVERTQTLRNNPYTTCHSHEIMISRPAGDDVQVQVRLNTCSRCSAEIPADIECFGLYHVTKEMLRVD